MPVQLRVPTSNEVRLIDLENGDVLFLVGINGSGKSSLLHSMYVLNQQRSRRIAGHRQAWFSGNMASVSAQVRKSEMRYYRESETDTRARSAEVYNLDRAGVALFDLLRAENGRGRLITQLLEDGQEQQAAQLLAKQSPLAVINGLLQAAHTRLQLEIDPGEAFMARKAGGDPYPINLLSDGERNILLIAIEVLTAPGDTVIFIDEPERHLHRSVISPLLSQLFAERPDCVFVVATHDPYLAAENVRAKKLLVRGYSSTGRTAESWDVDILADGESIDEQLLVDLMGARRVVLVVEGVERSLDKALYGILFPMATVVARRACRDVEQAVAALSGVSEHHWVTAYGVVDRDGRSDEDVQRLKEGNVYAIDSYSVESLYYHPEVQARVAERVLPVIGGDLRKALEAAMFKMLSMVKQRKRHLVERAVEKRVRMQIFEQLPTLETIRNGRPVSIVSDVEAVFAQEATRLDQLIDTEDLSGIVRSYPIRETGALKEFAQSLGLLGRDEYERAVRKMLMADTEMVAKLRALFGDLYARLRAKD